MTKLYVVKTEITTVVQAATPEAAMRVAESVVGDGLNEGFGIHTYKELTSLTDLPEDWSDEECPFSEHLFDTRTIREILSGKD